MRRLLFTRSRGFTLIELLVVIVILGILMAVAVPTFLAQQTKAQDSTTQQYLTTAFKAIRTGVIGTTGNQYPSSTSMVSWIISSEPELTAQAGSCINGVQSAPQNRILVDPSSTPTSLTICARSQSGNVWKLTATNTGVQQLLNGTLVALTETGGVINDANRGTQGDGFTNDSSTGIWEAATNLELNGGLETNASYWSGWAHGSTPMPTVTRDATYAKFGTYSLKVATQGANVSEGAASNTAAGSIMPSSAYTATAWVYTPTSQQFQMDIDWKDSSNAYISGSNTISTVPGGVWTRLTASGTAPANTDHITTLVYAINGTPTPTTYWIDGIQVEQRSYATPYVETNGMTATRAAASVQAPSGLLNNSQGWFAVRVRYGFSSSNPPEGGAGWDTVVNAPATSGSGGDYLRLMYREGSTDWRFRLGDTTDSWDAASSATSFNAGDYATVVGTYSTSGGLLYTHLSLNGSAFSDMTGSPAPYIGPFTFASTFDIGSVRGFAEWFDGDVLWFASGTGTLSNADAVTINSWGNTDPKVASFPSSAEATTVWDGESTDASLK